MRGYQAHESFWADFKMYRNLFQRALVIGLLVQLLFIFVAAQAIMNSANRICIRGTATRMPATVVNNYFFYFDLLGNGVTVEPGLRKYVRGAAALPQKTYRQFADWLTGNAYQNLTRQTKLWFKLSFLSYLLSVLYLVLFIKKAPQMEEDKYVRGAVLLTIEQLNQKLEAAAKSGATEPIKIGDTTIPFEMESKHLLILGTSGSGKGVLANQLVAQINARKMKSRPNDRCIFYDLKGEYIAKQYNQKRDLIFNPFDERSVAWTLFNEIESYPDYDVIAKSLFLPPDSRDTYWYNCASDVFRAGLIYLDRNNFRTNRDLLDFFSLSLDDIKYAFSTLPLAEQGAMKHIDNPESHTGSTIISILNERILFLKYLADLDGDFSFRKFIRNQQTASGVNPNLYILNIDQYKTIFQPLMSFAIDTLIRETLSIPDQLDRRIYFILDELGSLFKMESIIDLLTVGRSKGACLFCANQDLGRIKDIYGESNVETVFNNFNTIFVFRINDPKTSDFLSQAMGERQLIRRVETRQMSPDKIGDHKSIADQEITEKLILGTEFQNFNDLHALLKISNFGVSRIVVPKIFYKERHINFMMKRFAALEVAPASEPVPGPAPAAAGQGGDVEPDGYDEEAN
jgi:type IV secretory pathway TraG/TraD family ATPase VirD4